MTPDALIDRLRDADPAREHRPPPPRAAVAAARRRRSSRRTAAGVLATAGAALVIALAPLGGGGGAPSVLAQAAEAAKLRPGSIVVTTTAVEVRSNVGGMEQRRTTWVRVGPGGRALASRVRNEEDGKVTADQHSSGFGADAVLRSLDPETGELTTERGTRQVPGLLYEARAFLARAQRDGEVTDTRFAGRPAYRVVVTGADTQSTSSTGTRETPLAGDRDELLLDAETLAPLVLRKHSEGLDVNGDPFTYDYTERVLEQRTLPDTPANRVLLTPR